jgi:ferritin
MLDKKIEKALNQQINMELSAAYHYLAMGAYFEDTNLSGFASWMLAQRQEELTHAMKLFQYVLHRGGKVELEAVEKPPSNFKTPKDAFLKALALEQANTAAIYDLYKLATQIGDYATQSHLKWFLDEQVEEEHLFDEAKSLFEIAGEEPSALLLLNEKFGQRAAGSMGGGAK